MKNHIKIGTRASKLALTQANMVKAALEEKKFSAEIIKITTKGDVDQRDFHKILGDGFFTRSIEKALLLNEIDVAIHSAKDLPSLQHHNLPWQTFSSREDTADVLIQQRGVEIKKIGTSSPRRQKQIVDVFPTAQVLPLRGNVDTRIQKLRDKEYDAIILAKAGLLRLNLLHELKKEFDCCDLNIVSAPTQGILAIQSRREDLDVLNTITNTELSLVAKQEKEVLKYLGGGCHLAIGANATKGDFDFFTGEQRYTFKNKTSDYLQDVSTCVSENTFAKKVILTHSIQQHEKVSRLFAKEQIGTYSFPLIETKTIFAETDWQRDILTYDLIFTSPNAVRIFFQEAFARDFDVSQWQARKIFCVGKATAKQLAQYGFSSEALPDVATSKDLAGVITSEKPLYCGNPEGEFSQHFACDVLPLYKSFPYEKLWQRPPSYCNHIVFCSASSVEFALTAMGKEALQDLKVYSFGPSTSSTLQKHAISYIENPISGSWNDMLELVKSNL